MATQTQQRMSASQVNGIARQAIRAQAQRRLQQIFSQTFATPSSNPVININPRNVGLICGFWVKVTGTVTNGSGVTINASDFSTANILSQIQFNDLQNNTRIQTTGWHIAFLNTWKNKRVFASALIGPSGNNTGLQTTAGAYQGIDSPINYGSNWTTNSSKASIAAAGTETITHWYYVPLAYNPDGPNGMDLRGAVYANVINATQQLLLTFNPTVAVANGADSTSSMFVGANAGSVAAVTFTNATVTIYQDYLDQLPTSNNGVLLPVVDLAYIYDLKYTTVNSMVAGQDYPYQYPNYRDVLSTLAVYVNNGTTGARGTGADINYWALQSANFSNIWKVEPDLAIMPTRKHIGADYPPGTYMFDSRERPISTTQYGNMELILNAITATNSPYMFVALENFALVQQLSMAGSLQAQ